MKFESTVIKIKEAVATAERITGKNLSLPALSSILIIASGKSVKIRATNLSLGIEIEVSAKVSQEGVLAINGAIFSNLMSNISDNGNIGFEEKNGNLAVISKSTNATLKCVSSEDFPTLPTVSGTEIKVSATKFLQGLKSVVFAGSISDIKPEISSVYIYPDNDNIVFVATDSFRLAEKKIKSKTLPEFSHILIPLKNTSDIIRTLQETKEDITITISEHQASFVCGGIYLTSRLINGAFPDYRHIIPKETLTTAVILKNDLQQALKVSNIFSDKFNQITLSINPKNKNCTLYSKNADIGEQKSILSAALNGEDTEVSINFRYLNDVFQSISSDSVSVECNQPNRPIKMKGVGDESFLYLVMPMNR